MTERPDNIDQTAGAKTDTVVDGTSGAAYGSGQTGARAMLGAVVAVCAVGLVWAFWPADRSSSMLADAGMEQSRSASGETPGADQMSVAPGTDRVEGNQLDPEPAGVDPADAGEGLGMDPDLDATDEEEPRDDPEIDPTDRVAPVDPPGSGDGR
ncbi:hypothetical protein ACWCOP_10830 [Maricaulaceae bacterium MS644]